MIASLTIDVQEKKAVGVPGYFRYTPGEGVHLLKGEERDQISAQVMGLNEVLRNEEELENSWRHFCAKRRQGVLRLTNLIPRWQGYLIRKGVLKRPYFHDNSLLGGLNVLRCAAHREVAETVLEMEAKKRFETFI